MDFSKALEYVKNGKKIGRSGWNGKGLYVVMQKGYPDGIAINKNTSEATGVPEGTICVFKPYLLFKTTNNSFFPWTPNQEDILAEDWGIF